MQKTDLNVAPYYDDFDEDDNFKKILFRPGFSIQARELTQLQSNLQNQIEQQGNHIFRDGDMVIPGQISLAPQETLKLVTTFSGESIDPSQYFNATNPITITGETTGVTAKVTGFSAATSVDQPLLHISYINNGTDNETINFADGENIIADTGITHTASYDSGVASATTFTSTLAATASNLEKIGPNGPASTRGVAAIIEEGVYYIRGHFVKCLPETLIINNYTENVTTLVGFNVKEEIVTPELDTTLLDNSTGSNNFAAKGAHRLKFSLSLTTLPSDTAPSSEEIKNFIQLAEKSDDKTIVGERTKRSESLFFKICYQLHKLLTLGFTGHSIKFGNFTCLSKSTIEKMLNEKATWNSFSGSLKKVEKDLLSIPSIRGTRYFGPSKMSFFNLLKHSLSIISVFRKTVLIRSAFFIVFYILLMQSNASIITSVPLVLLLIMIYSISNLALRENLDEFDKCLLNINDIEKIK